MSAVEMIARLDLDRIETFLNGLDRQVTKLFSCLEIFLKFFSRIE